MNVVRALYRLQPFRLADREAFGIRLLFAIVVYWNLPLDNGKAFPFVGPHSWLRPGYTKGYETQPFPNGIANWLDISFIHDPAFLTLLWIISLVALISYVWGRGLFWSAPVLTLILILDGTLSNSQGFIGHAGQLLALILLVQSLIIVGRAATRGFRKNASSAEDRRRTNDLMYYYSLVTIIGTYMVAGLTKLRNSDGEWIFNSPYIGLYLIKAHRQKNFIDPPDLKEIPYALAMLEHPTLTRLFMGGGLILELFCVVALFGRAWAFGVGLLLIIFHRICGEVMQLPFTLNQELLFVFLVNPVFLLGSAAFFIYRKYILEKTPS